TAVVHQEFEGLIKEKIFSVDSLASVKLIDVKPDYLHYETENTQPGTIVFSEIYYPHGWNAYLNGKEVPHFRADYTLRAIHVPEGYNKIEFKFEPEVVRKGNSIA